MAQVLWTPAAEFDLDEILFYMAFVDRRPATGERLYYEIRDRVVEHADNGLPGHVPLSASEVWLYLKHKRWLVFYQPHPEGMEVMRASTRFATYHVAFDDCNLHRCRQDRVQAAIGIAEAFDGDAHAAEHGDEEVAQRREAVVLAIEVTAGGDLAAGAAG